MAKSGLGGFPPNPPIGRTGASPKPPPQGVKGEPKPRFALVGCAGVNCAVRWECIQWPIAHQKLRGTATIAASLVVWGIGAAR